MNNKHIKQYENEANNKFILNARLRYANMKCLATLRTLL